MWKRGKTWIFAILFQKKRQITIGGYNADQLWCLSNRVGPARLTKIQMIKNGLDYNDINELLKDFVGKHDIELDEHKGYLTLGKALNKVMYLLYHYTNNETKIFYKKKQ